MSIKVDTTAQALGLAERRGAVARDLEEAHGEGALAAGRARGVRRSCGVTYAGVERVLYGGAEAQAG